MSPHLQAETVSFEYERGVPVLNRVDASVRGGVMTGIVGPNGSGKSTLLRMLSGLIAPLSGRILLDGRPLASYRSRDRARMLGFLPQSVNPAFALSAFEVVCLGRYPHTGGLGALTPKDIEVARGCLRETNTEPLRDRPFLDLSGGERQRVLLAGVLAQEPKILLLDEPTSALDIHHQAEVFSLLGRLARQGYGVAVVTHDLNAAAQYCSDLVLLSGAHRLLAAGEPEKVLTSELLSEAYGAAILSGRHPFFGTPFVSAQPPEGLRR